MTIHVYNVNQAPEDFRKDLSVIVSPVEDGQDVGWSGAARDSVSIDEPVILVQAEVMTGNYCYIDEFARYYYITERNLIRKDLTELTLLSDPLMSFADQILGLSILVDRCTKKAEPADPAGYNSLLPDQRIRISAQSYYREFPITGLDLLYPTNYNAVTPQYVLGVIG